ncbi:MAG: DUF1963 domain-containing protein [Deltaproteobacteria bacterium]|nr:DUF1963 domain-containing protein [Deltaproteobacteria bacterium]
MAAQTRDLPFPTDVPTLEAPPDDAPLAAQLALFVKAVDVGPLGWTDALAAGRSKSDIERGEELLNTEPLWEQVQDRLTLIDDLAKRLVTHADNPAVAAALTRVIKEHPCNEITRLVGEAVVTQGAPAAALLAAARWIGEPAKYGHHRWTTGARAVLRSATPAAASDTLAPHLAKKEYASRVLDALRQHDGEIDPRFFEAARRWVHGGPGLPRSTDFLAKHATRPEVQALLVREIEKIAAAKGEPETGYFYQDLRQIKVPGALPALVKIVARSAKLGDWHFTVPLSAIEDLADPAALPQLRALVATLKGKAKSAVAAAIAGLEKTIPGAAVAEPPPKKATAAKAKPARAASPAARPLVEAGLAVERAEKIVALARTRIDLAPKKIGKPPVGTTRFGGEPDLPAKTAWPHVDCTEKDLVLKVSEYPKGTIPAPDKKGKLHVPLAFLAQLDLDDLAPHDTDALLPKTGMLWFFARPEVVLGEKRELQRIASLVLYAKKKPKLVRISPPATLGAQQRFDAATVKITHVRPLPSPNLESIRKLALIESESEAYEAATSNADDGATHASLGWAIATYYLGIPEAKEQLLLRVGSDAVSGFSFGDNASIFFCVPTAALAKRDFTKAYCVMDE